MGKYEASDLAEDSGLEEVMRHLRCSKYGLSISDIARKTGLNRNTISKYLQLLSTLGQTEMRVVGPSRIYQLSERLPISSAFLKAQPEPTCVVTTAGIILWVNEYLESWLKSCYAWHFVDIVGKSFETAGPELFKAVAKLPEYRASVEGKMPTVGKWSYLNIKEMRYRLWILPVVFYEGTSGVMIQIEEWGRF